MGMKNLLVFIGAATLLFCSVINSYAQKTVRSKQGDTNGVADIESRLVDFKVIAEAMTTNMSKCGNLDSLKRFAAIMQTVDDTILNHIAPIFDGFNSVHPDQYDPLKNINDLVDRIVSTKDLVKAKKNTDKILVEYNNLLKAK
jgi:hypothetical protein